MNDFEIDTKELYTLGSDIMKLSGELNEEFEELFKRITNVNKTTGEWIGNSANEFVARAKLEKVEYVKFKNSLYNYGKSLCDIATEYENAMAKVGA